jgi:hypothetical protein
MVAGLRYPAKNAKLVEFGGVHSLGIGQPRAVARASDQSRDRKGAVAGDI